MATQTEEGGRLGLRWLAGFAGEGRTEPAGGGERRAWSLPGVHGEELEGQGSLQEGRRGGHARHADELPAWPRVEDDPAPGGLGRLLARLGQVGGPR